MAYSDVIDEAAPDEDEEVSLGDDRMRELKRALNERLATVFGDWPTAEPLQLLGAALPDDIIVTRMIAVAQVTSILLADGAADTQRLGANAVTEPKLADDSVSTRTIVTAAVTSVKMADGAADTQRIGDLAVTTPKLADDAVETAKIATAAVTTSKLADGAVTADKLASVSIADLQLVSQGIIAERHTYDLTITVVSGDSNAASSHNDAGVTFTTDDIFLCQAISTTGGGGLQGWMSAGQYSDAHNFYFQVFKLIGSAVGVDTDFTIRVHVCRRIDK